MRTEKIMLVVKPTDDQEGAKKRYENKEVERLVHRAASLEAFVKETWDKTRRGSQVIESIDFQNRIWLAIGGDKGVGTTKLVISYLNVESPASVSNLHILAIYEGNDSAENLRRVLAPYHNEWDRVSKLLLPYKELEDGTSESSPLSIFLYGDLMFQTAFLGLRGTASKCPCPLCLIPLDRLRKPGPAAFEETYQRRSLEQYHSAIERGTFADGVFQLSIFQIPVEQHAPPVLHLYLGIGTLLIDQIEKAAKEIDMKQHGAAIEQTLRHLQELSRNVDALGREHEDSVQVASDQSKLLAIIHSAAQHDKDPENQCRAPLCFADNDFFGEELNWVVCDSCGRWYHMECCMVFDDSEKERLKMPEIEFTCPPCQGNSMDKNAVLDAAQEGVVAAADVETVLREAYEKAVEERDHFQQAQIQQTITATALFEKSLQSLGIDRQAFHGGVFIGNHIKKAVDGEGPVVLTECLSTKKHLQTKYISLLTQLNEIRKLMGIARFLTDDEIRSLDAACNKMGQLSDFYRGKDDTVIPKMHILVKYVPEFARRWRTVGLISEHGIEALHGFMNKLFMRYACIRGLGRKLALVVKEHERRQEAVK